MGEVIFQRNRRRPAPASIDAATCGAACIDALRKLAPQHLMRNTVMAVVAACALLAAAITLAGLAPVGFGWAVATTLLMIVLFANFAESLAQARGRGQIALLRRTHRKLTARRIDDIADYTSGRRDTEIRLAVVELRPGDLVVVSAGELVPTDGEIEHGLATINEAAVTGESAPVLRAAGTDRSNVLGGTKVLTDEIVVRVTAEFGHGFLDRMIALAEGASRQKTPNDVALTMLLAAMTLTFLVVCATLSAIGVFLGGAVDPLVLIALLACLIPTTVGGLLSTIRIAGMNRAQSANVLAKSCTAMEAAGNLDVLLLDKSGAITHGDRQATAFHPLAGVNADQLREAALLSSLADPTPEGRSVVRLALEQGAAMQDPEHAQYVQLTAHTRLSGVDLLAGDNDTAIRVLRKGASDAIERHVRNLGLDGEVMAELQARVAQVARSGATPLVVSEGGHLLGVIELSDGVKHGVKERFARLRAMGIKTVMITGDNPLTAAAIAAEAGVDDYIAQARPGDKLRRIRSEQAAGRAIAMAGGDTHDAPALAQADVGLAMNSGTQTAKQAGNMVDLDSDPAKLLVVAELGRQQLSTRSALTAFSLVNDVAKWFAILPALIAVASAATGVGSMTALNVMGLSSPRNAVLAALIYSALIIPALLPLALRGVRFKPAHAAALLRRNRWIYGIGGVLLPFAAIKLIDLVLAATIGA